MTIAMMMAKRISPAARAWRGSDEERNVAAIGETATPKLQENEKKPRTLFRSLPSSPSVSQPSTDGHTSDMNAPYAARQR